MMADANDAPLWHILEEVERILKTMTFDVRGNDPVSAIDTANEITIVKPPIAGEQDYFERLPERMLVTPPKRYEVDPHAGENVRDDISYPVLVQFHDKDNEGEIAGLRTYLHWTDIIHSKFRNAGLSNISSVDTAHVWNCHATGVMHPDTELWVTSRWFVAGVELRFVSREKRG